MCFKQTDAKAAEIMARLTALERERAEIVAKINPLQPMQGEETSAVERVLSETETRRIVS
jgi:hypothetical protein